MDELLFAERMRRDWDARAERNAAWFVDYLNWRSEAEIDRAGRSDVEHVLSGLDPAALRSARVLEIGCGIARVLRPLAERVGRAVGVDVSPGMLARARERTKDVENVELVPCDGTGSLPFPDRSFDAAYSIYVFEHVPAAVTWRYLGEAARVLAPGAWFRFQFTTPLRPADGPPPASPEELELASTEVVDTMPDGVAEFAFGETIEGEPIELDAMLDGVGRLGFEVDRSTPTGANNVAMFARRV